MPIIVILLIAILITLLDAWHIAGWIIATVIALSVVVWVSGIIFEDIGNLVDFTAKIWGRSKAKEFLNIGLKKITVFSVSVWRRSPLVKLMALTNSVWRRNYLFRMLRAKDIKNQIQKRKDLGYEADDLEERLSQAMQEQKTKK